MIQTVPAGAGVDLALLEEVAYSLVGLTALAWLVATLAAAGFRGYTTRRLPLGAAVLTGVAVVGAWLNVAALSQQAVVATVPLVHPATAAYLLGVGLLAGGGAAAGWRVGDYVGRDVYGVPTVQADGELARFLRSAAHVVEVRLPDHVEDAEGYDPVDDEVERALAGRTLLVPRRLSDAEVADRVSRRLERDFDVDYVRVEFDESGAVEELALGRRPSTLGRSLPPGTVAVAVAADPSSEAGHGDPVEVWSTDTGELVATGVLDATVGDVATVVVDSNDVDVFEAGTRYRLTTRPDRTSHVHELVAAVRSADETVATVSVEAGGTLEGEFVGWLPVTVVVIDRRGGPVPFPEERETLQAGDTAYVLGTPPDLDRLADYDGRPQGDGESEAPARTEGDAA